MHLNFHHCCFIYAIKQHQWLAYALNSVHLICFSPWVNPQPCKNGVLIATPRRPCYTPS